MFPRSAFLTLSLAVLCAGSAMPAPFPIVASSDGMTVTVTDASWVDANTRAGAAPLKALLIHYQVAGDRTVPFAVAAANTCCTFLKPTGENIGYNPFHGGGVCNWAVSPAWKTAKVRFFASDPSATPEATSGTATSMLKWENIRVPAERDRLYPIGVRQETTRGTGVVLDSVIVRSPSPSTAGRSQTVFIFRVEPTKRGGFQATLGYGIELRDETGASLLPANSMYSPQNENSLTGDEDYLSYVLPIAVDESHAGSMNLTVPVGEHSESLRDPRAFRRVTLDIPLAGLPGAEETGPEKVLAHAQSGGLEATIESIAIDGAGQADIRIWLKSPEGAPAYRPGLWQIASDAGEKLMPFGYCYPDSRMWKSNGGVPAPNERSWNLGGKLTRQLDSTDKNLSITLKAIAEEQKMRRFAFKKVPNPSIGQTSTADIASREMDGDGTTLTITNVRRVANNGPLRGAIVPEVLQIYYRLEGAGAAPKERMINPTSIVDDQGRTTDCIKHFSMYGWKGRDPYLCIIAPAADAKSFDIGIKTTDFLELAPPETLTFPNVPAP